MTRRLYTAAALVLSEQAAGTAAGRFTSLSEPTSIRALFAFIHDRYQRLLQGAWPPPPPKPTQHASGVDDDDSSRS